MSDRLFTKDPDAVLDYSVDWSDWLAAGDVIASASWIVDPGIDVDTEINDDTSATIWLSGGTIGQAYKAISRITTTDGRTDDRTVYIKIADK